MEPNIFVYALWFQAILQQQTVCGRPWGHGCGGGWREEDATHLVWRLLQHRRLPVPIQFAVPVTRLAGPGIQKVLLPVLKICVGGKNIDSQIWERKFLTPERQGQTCDPGCTFPRVLLHLMVEGLSAGVPSLTGGFRTTHCLLFLPNRTYDDSTLPMLLRGTVLWKTRNSGQS